MIFGFVALALSLAAMSFKNVTRMRLVHSMAAIVHIIYGYNIGAIPIIIGGILFLLIHLYHLRSFFKQNST